MRVTVKHHGALLCNFMPFLGSPIKVLIADDARSLQRLVLIADDARSLQRLRRNDD
jgi:hypothetical protein